MKHFRPELQTTEAVVVRTNNFGESDRLINIVTPHHGLIRGIVKGAKKPRSRIGGPLDLLKFVKLSVRINTNLSIFTQAETLNGFPGFRNNVSRMARGSYIGEIAEKFSMEGNPNPSLFKLLVESLSILEDTVKLEMLTRWYEVKLLQVTGFAPELDNCVETGKTINPGNHLFSTDKGGLVSMGAKPFGGQPLLPASINTIKLLKNLKRSNWLDICNVKVDDNTLRSAARILRQYLHYTLGSSAKSESFMDDIRYRESNQQQNSHNRS